MKNEPQNIATEPVSNIGQELEVVDSFKKKTPLQQNYVHPLDNSSSLSEEIFTPPSVAPYSQNGVHTFYDI